MEIDARLALRIHEREPITVEVEPVVVGPPARPHLVVLAVEVVRDEGLGSVHVSPMRVAVAPVRVEHRLDMKDPFPAVTLHVRSRPRDEPVCGQHRRFGR